MSDNAAVDMPRVEYGTVEFEDDLALVDGKPFTGVVFANYPNGSMEMEASYREGLPDGPQRRWHPNGNIEEEWIAIRGHGASIARKWYDNGRMKRRDYRRFQWTTRIQEWTEDGQLARDEKISLTEVDRQLIASIEEKLGITSWPEEDEPSRPS